MQIEITEETNSFRARPPMPMKQITGHQARGPGFDTPSRHTRVIPGS